MHTRVSRWASSSMVGQMCRRWLRLVGSLKLQVYFAEYRLFSRALLQNTHSYDFKEPTNRSHPIGGKCVA